MMPTKLTHRLFPWGILIIVWLAYVSFWNKRMKSPKNTNKSCIDASRRRATLFLDMPLFVVLASLDEGQNPFPIRMGVQMWIIQQNYSWKHFVNTALQINNRPLVNAFNHILKKWSTDTKKIGVELCITLQFCSALWTT